jgi:hypothetical protein
MPDYRSQRAASPDLPIEFGEDDLLVIAKLPPSFESWIPASD